MSGARPAVLDQTVDNLARLGHGFLTGLLATIGALDLRPHGAHHLGPVHVDLRRLNRWNQLRLDLLTRAGFVYGGTLSTRTVCKPILSGIRR